MGDCCDFCEVEHDFDRDLGDNVNLFRDTECHYLETTCPNCGIASEMFSDDWFDLIAEAVASGLKIHLWHITPDEVQQSRTRAQTMSEVAQAVDRHLEEMME